MRRWAGSSLLFGLAVGLVAPAKAQTDSGEGPVTRIDHFFAETAAFQELLQFFKGTLRLPQAWPDQDYGSFATGAVSLGNVTLEVVRFADSSPDRATFAGIALEPAGDTDALIGWLTAVGMDYEPPQAFPPAGPAFFVNTSLPQLSSGATEVFVCDYKDRRMILDGQAAAAAALAADDGGPLGILGVLELTLETTDIDRSLGVWSELVATAERDGDDVVVGFESGPAIRVVPGATDRLTGITISVRSMDAAEAFLDEADLAERDATGELRIARGAVGGLELTLVER